MNYREYKILCSDDSILHREINILSKRESKFISMKENIHVLHVSRI